MFTLSRHAAIAAVISLGAAGLASPASAQQEYGLGRAATPAEVSAWDIDVRPDFKGLPKGSGTVDQGEAIWESTCAVCHGTFAESNLVFTPLVGGTTLDDIETGRVASLTDPTQSTRTTIMKVPTVSTLWDYIHRAMPWDNPRSLTPDQVYATLAYLLSLAEIVDFDFTLSDENIAEVQERMPNRNGVMFWEGLWKVDGQPDTNNTACMKDCVEEIDVSSELPDYARDAHGDWAAQMRIVGPVRGVNALEPALSGSVLDNADAVREHARTTLEETLLAQAPAAASADAGAADVDIARVTALMKDNGCLACHARDAKVLGPSYLDVAGKYQGQSDAHDKLVAKIQKGGGGAWGPVPMPPHPDLSDEDAGAMVDWILVGAPQ